MWNVVAVGGGLEYGAEGQPLANSHYGYHMASKHDLHVPCTYFQSRVLDVQVMWHIPFALSGQHWDAPSASLTFSPKLSAPFSLPVFVPGSAFVLIAHEAGGGALRLVAGRSMTLKAVIVGNSSAAHLPKTLAVGDTIEW